MLKHPDTVHFDPSVKQHRQAAHAFMRRGTWADSPLRFAYDPAHGSVADQVRNKMLTWYVAQDQKRINK